MSDEEKPKEKTTAEHIADLVAQRDAFMTRSSLTVRPTLYRGFDADGAPAVLSTFKIRGPAAELLKEQLGKAYYEPGLKKIGHETAACGRSVCELRVGEILAERGGALLPILDVGTAAGRTTGAISQRYQTSYHFMCPNLHPGDEERMREVRLMLARRRSFGTACSHTMADCHCLEVPSATLFVHSAYYSNPQYIAHRRSLGPVFAIIHRFTCYSGLLCNGEIKYSYTADGLIQAYARGNAHSYTHPPHWDLHGEGARLSGDLYVVATTDTEFLDTYLVEYSVVTRLQHQPKVFEEGPMASFMRAQSKPGSGLALSLGGLLGATVHDLRVTFVYGTPRLVVDGNKPLALHPVVFSKTRAMSAGMRRDPQTLAAVVARIKSELVRFDTQHADLDGFYASVTIAFYMDLEKEVTTSAAANQAMNPLIQQQARVMEGGVISRMRWYHFLNPVNVWRAWTTTCCVALDCMDDPDLHRQPLLGVQALLDNQIAPPSGFPPTVGELVMRVPPPVDRTVPPQREDVVIRPGFNRIKPVPTRVVKLEGYGLGAFPTAHENTEENLITAVRSRLSIEELVPDENFVNAMLLANLPADSLRRAFYDDGTFVVTEAMFDEWLPRFNPRQRELIVKARGEIAKHGVRPRDHDSTIFIKREKVDALLEGGYEPTVPRVVVGGTPGALAMRGPHDFYRAMRVRERLEASGKIMWAAAHSSAEVATWLVDRIDEFGGFENVVILLGDISRCEARYHELIQMLTEESAATWNRSPEYIELYKRRNTLRAVNRTFGTRVEVDDVQVSGQPNTAFDTGERSSLPVIYWLDRGVELAALEGGDDDVVVIPRQYGIGPDDYVTLSAKFGIKRKCKAARGLWDITFCQRILLPRDDGGFEFVPKIGRFLSRMPYNANDMPWDVFAVARGFHDLVADVPFLSEFVAAHLKHRARGPTARFAEHVMRPGGQWRMAPEGWSWLNAKYGVEPCHLDLFKQHLKEMTATPPPALHPWPLLTVFLEVESGE